MLNNINISRTMIDDKGFTMIIDSIPDHLESLDVSENNKLTIFSYEKLSYMLDDPCKQ